MRASSVIQSGGTRELEQPVFAARLRAGQIPEFLLAAQGFRFQHPLGLDFKNAVWLAFPFVAIDNPIVFVNACYIEWRYSAMPNKGSQKEIVICGLYTQAQVKRPAPAPFAVGALVTEAERRGALAVGGQVWRARRGLPHSLIM